MMTTTAVERHIIDSGEVIRSMTPRRLGSLYCLNQPSVHTQTEIATQLGCSPPTVSQHMHKLSSLPIQVVEKVGASHVPTEFGSNMIDIFDYMLSYLDIDITTVDWSQDDPLDGGLYPLHTARGSMIFLLLDALGRQISFGSELDLFCQESKIYISEVVSDIQSLNYSIETSDRRIKRQMRKLEESGCVSFGEKTVTLSKKGFAQIWVVKEIRDLIQSQRSKSDTSEASKTVERIPVSLSEEGPGELIEPVLYLDDEPVLVIGDSMTLAELRASVNEMMQENDGDETLETQWTIRRN